MGRSAANQESLDGHPNGDYRNQKSGGSMQQSDLIKVTAVTRLRSALVVNAQLQDDARERIALGEAEGAADLKRAKATEKNLIGQLDCALATEKNLKDLLQGVEA
jgi:hypothetical protein